MSGSEPSSLCERLAGEVAGELRLRIVSHSRVCRESGEPLGDIARRLGLVESTLARWLRSDPRALAAGFRSVSIVPEVDEEAAAPAGALRLVRPRCHLVEGRDAPTLVFLLGAVG